MPGRCGIEAKYFCPVIENVCHRTGNGSTVTGECGRERKFWPWNPDICPKIMELIRANNNYDPRSDKSLLVVRQGRVFFLQHAAKGNPQGWYIEGFEGGKFIRGQQCDGEDWRRDLENFLNQV